MFSMKHEFPTEWYRFLHPNSADSEQILTFTVGKERFPFFAQDRDIAVKKVDVFAKCAKDEDYIMVLSCVNLGGDIVTSSEITMPQSDVYGNLNKVTLNENDAGLALDELNIAGEIKFKVKSSSATDFSSLSTDPEEVDNMYLVFHYSLG